MKEQKMFKKEFLAMSDIEVFYFLIAERAKK